MPSEIALFCFPLRFDPIHTLPILLFNPRYLAPVPGCALVLEGLMVVLRSPLDSWLDQERMDPSFGEAAAKSATEFRDEVCFDLFG